MANINSCQFVSQSEKKRKMFSRLMIGNDL